MKKWALILFAALAIGAAPSDRTHFFVVEYKRANGSVPDIEVIFYVPVTAAVAENVLRYEPSLAIQVAPPEQEVMLSAWDGRGKKPLEEDHIALVDGSLSLWYNPKTKQVLTEKQKFQKIGGGSPASRFVCIAHFACSSTAVQPRV
jgi:hypothetical protein